MTFLRGLILPIVVLLCVPLLNAQSKVATLNLTFTTIDVPGAGVTWASGVNTVGDVVGWYSQADNMPSSGFLLSGGNFTFLNYPGGYDTVARGINNTGVVVGNAYVSSEGAVGFTYQNGVFSAIQIGTYPTPLRRESTTLGTLSAATASAAVRDLSYQEQNLEMSRRRELMGQFSRPELIIMAK